MRGARIYYPRVPRLMRDDHRRISSRCVRNRNSSCTTSLDHTRYKTLPARLARRPTRYKTLPASGSAAHPVQNSPSKPQNADFGPLFACRENFVPLPPPTTRAGRTLSRMRCHFRYKTLPARPARRPTRYKTLPASGSAAHPVQNSPSKPQNADFGPLFACRENFVPLPPPTRQAGRKKSRTNTPPHPPTRPSPNFACNSIE